MNILKFSSVLVIAVLISCVAGKDFRCRYQQVKIHHANEKVIACNFENINFEAKDSFRTVLPVDPPPNFHREEYDYDDPEDSIESVDFIDSHLEAVPQSIFGLFKFLRYFHGSEKGIKELTTLSFNKAEYLEYIFLDRNHLKTIKDYVFNHSKNLKVLELAYNDIETIGKSAFSSLTELKKLSLSNNKIKMIQDGTFRSLTSLEYIWLSHNQLQEILSEIFSKENGKLKIVNLENNALTAISPYAFEELPSLEYLHLAGNKCVNKNFNNMKISSNVGVKFELKECIKKYRKIFHADDAKYNVINIFNSLMERNQQCENETQRILDEIKKINETILQLENEVVTEVTEIFDY